jgi:hypothetical protein
MLFAFIRRLKRDRGGDCIATLALALPYPALLLLAA